MVVSIPQAVSTVATIAKLESLVEKLTGFNTASGKYCCNGELKGSDITDAFNEFQYRKR